MLREHEHVEADLVRPCRHLEGGLVLRPGLGAVESWGPHIEPNDGHGHDEILPSPAYRRRLEHVLVCARRPYVVHPGTSPRFSLMGRRARRSARTSRHRGPTEGEPCPKPSSLPHLARLSAVPTRGRWSTSV